MDPISTESSLIGPHFNREFINGPHFNRVHLLNPISTESSLIGPHFNREFINGPHFNREFITGNQISNSGSATYHLRRKKQCN